MPAQSETYAFVDIETTGLFHSQHAITEIAVWRVCDGHVVSRFQTLVNPGRNIPAPIRRLTGLTDLTVAQAPAFPEIAEKVYALLDGAVLVAHNAPFDISFLKAAFALRNLAFNPKRICTMRLARKLLPTIRSVSLPALCDHFRLHSSDFHRAAIDVEATYLLFDKLKNLPGATDIIKIQTSRHALQLPPAFGDQLLSDLPTAPGVYYFKGANGKPIYIGKAKNLKQRIASHFSGGDGERKKQHLLKWSQKLDYKVTLNELEALLLEDFEIRKCWPVLNAAQKSRVVNWTIHPYKNRDGQYRLALSNRRCSDTFGSFHARSSAKDWLYRRLVESGIDTKVMGISWPDELVILPPRSDSESITRFLNEIELEFSQSVLIGIPAAGDLYQAVKIQNGRYLGFGAISAKELNAPNPKWVNFHAAPDTPAAWMVIRRMLDMDAVEVVDAGAVFVEEQLS